MIRAATPRTRVSGSSRAGLRPAPETYPACHSLRIGLLYAVTYEPVYSGVPVTRTNWASHPDGQRRVVREWTEVSRRTAEGGLVALIRSDGAWRVP